MNISLVYIFNISHTWNNIFEKATEAGIVCWSGFLQNDRHASNSLRPKLVVDVV